VIGGEVAALADGRIRYTPRLAEDPEKGLRRNQNQPGQSMSGM
jgi:hypothetical protein